MRYSLLILLILLAIVAIKPAGEFTMINSTEQAAILALPFLKIQEGYRQNAYWDAAGKKWTVGYGFTYLNGRQVVSTDSLNREQADRLLMAMAKKAAYDIDAIVTVPLNPFQLAALISLEFNIGRTAFKNSTLLKLLNKGDYNGASKEFLKWRYAGGEAILLSRRKREQSLFERTA
jgi:lysozyme